MRIVHAPQDGLDPVLAEGLRRITALAWPGATGRHDPALVPELFVAVDGDAVVAGLGVLSKEILHAGRRWAASGLSGVVTDPVRRHRGSAAALAGAAREWILGEHGADVGVLTCDRPLVAVYERAGWAVLEDVVLLGGTVDDPLPSDSPGMDKAVLVAWPEGEEGTVRRAFTGTRVALHPGTVDRLW